MADLAHENRGRDALGGRCADGGRERSGGERQDDATAHLALRRGLRSPGSRAAEAVLFRSLCATVRGLLQAARGRLSCLERCCWLHRDGRRGALRRRLRSIECGGVRKAWRSRSARLHRQQTAPPSCSSPSCATWCDPVLLGSQKSWIEDKLVSYADWYVANPPLDVFHNDMPNVWSAVGLAALALKGTAADANATQYRNGRRRCELQTDHFARVRLRRRLPGTRDMSTYIPPSSLWRGLRSRGRRRRTKNLFAEPATHVADLFNGYLAMQAYTLRPDDTFFYFGDTADDKQSIAYDTRPFVDMLTFGSHSALGQGFSNEIASALGSGRDYEDADAFLMALFYDVGQNAGAAPRSSLPTAAWLSPHAKDVAVLRSGWGPGRRRHLHHVRGLDGASRPRRVGELSDLPPYDPHRARRLLRRLRLKALVQLLRAALGPCEHDRGGRPERDVSDRPVPGGPECERERRGSAAHARGRHGQHLSRRQLERLSRTAHARGPMRETGNLLSMDHDGCHDYVACDVTAAYSSPGFVANGNAPKVTEVTRQFVFVRPEVLVVFDRVESTQPNFQKRFLLHSPRPPSVSGNSYVLTNGAGSLFVQTLLPASPQVGFCRWLSRGCRNVSAGDEGQ